MLAAATAALCCCFAATPAGAATVNLEIESLTGTVFNGQVSTTGASIKTTADSGCADDASSPVDSSGATPLTALATWATQNSTAFNTQYGGTYLCKIADVVNTNDAYWLMKINDKTQSSPGNYLLGTSPASEGDNVLWYYTDDYAKSTLALELPAGFQTGVARQLKVVAYDGNDDSKSPISGATVNIDGAAAGTSGSDGSISLTFPAAGRFLVSATKSGSIRTSDWVTVTDAPVPTLKQLNQVKRIAARAECKSKYASKSGVKYKLCVRAANKIGHSETTAEKRAAARAKCVAKYPTKGGAARVKCVRAANRLGR